MEGKPVSSSIDSKGSLVTPCSMSVWKGLVSTTTIRYDLDSLVFHRVEAWRAHEPWHTLVLGNYRGTGNASILLPFFLLSREFKGIQSLVSTILLWRITGKKKRLFYVFFVSRFLKWLKRFFSFFSWKIFSTEVCNNFYIEVYIVDIVGGVVNAIGYESTIVYLIRFQFGIESKIVLQPVRRMWAGEKMYSPPFYKVSGRRVRGISFNGWIISLQSLG